jgi:hypothetical protein
MTPNGAILFAAAAIIGIVMSDARGIAFLYALVLLFSLIEVGPRVVGCLRRATLVMAPLATFMLVIWVGIVGRAPTEIAAGVEGSRQAALLYVIVVAARLFLIVFLVQAVAMRFSHQTPLGFVRALNAPSGAKRLAILTLSLIETLRNSVDRAHTALVAAGVITRSVSLKNIGSGWILVQTVWLTAITTVTARMRDKWPIENTLALLGPALDGNERRLTVRDILWLALAIIVALAGHILSWPHA